MDAKQVTGALSHIAHGQAMLAAIRDYKKELEDQHATSGSDQGVNLDMDAVLDDPELQKLHEDRIAKLREEAEKRAEMSLKGHGSLTEITEGEFLEVVTKSHWVVCHFYHNEFERCKVMDKHLAQLAAKYFKTRFVKLHAPDATFFVSKLQIKVLPCVVCFVNGVAASRVVGFEGLGGLDDFKTEALEAKLIDAGVVAPVMLAVQDEAAERSTKLRKGFQPTESDEDSDFD